MIAFFNFSPLELLIILGLGCPVVVAVPAAVVFFILWQTERGKNRTPLPPPVEGGEGTSSPFRPGRKPFGGQS